MVALVAGGVGGRSRCLVWVRLLSDLRTPSSLPAVMLSQSVGDFSSTGLKGAEEEVVESPVHVCVRVCTLQSPNPWRRICTLPAVSSEGLPMADAQ